MFLVLQIRNLHNRSFLLANQFSRLVGYIASFYSLRNVIKVSFFNYLILQVILTFLVISVIFIPLGVVSLFASQAVSEDEDPHLCASFSFLSTLTRCFYLFM